LRPSLNHKQDERISAARTVGPRLAGRNLGVHDRGHPSIPPHRSRRCLLGASAVSQLAKSRRSVRRRGHGVGPGRIVDVDRCARRRWQPRLAATWRPFKGCNKGSVRV
jgi:hypothetical protein